MAKPKFTPGEWKFKKYPQNGDCTAGWVETDEEPICRVENINDGNLLAQSKVMYGALEVLAGFLRDNKFYSTSKECRRIMALARGETEPNG